MPKASCVCWRRGCSIACFAELFYDLCFRCSHHIACRGATDLTGPDEKKKQHADFRNEIAKIKYHDSSRHAVDTNPRFIGRANFLWKLSSLDKKLKVNPMKRKRRKQ